VGSGGGRPAYIRGGTVALDPTAIIHQGGIGRLSSLDSGPLAGQATLPCRARAGPWAELAAQARARGRAVPGTGTQAAGPGRAWAVLSRVVPVPAHRARPIWKTLGQMAGWGCHRP